MPIPTTRAALIDQIGVDRGRLLGELDGLDPAVAESLAVEGGWPLAGLLAVRTWWADAVAGWIEAGCAGGHPVVPGEGFSWRETPRWNAELVAAAAARGLDVGTARSELDGALERVLAQVATLTDSELLDQGVFDWAGHWPVCRWVSVNTATQLRSARSLIRKAMRSR